MNRNLLLALCVLVPATVRAGDDVSARWKALETPAVKLVRALGTGELPAPFTRVSDIAADGKTAAYVDFVGVTQDKLGDTRVLLWDIDSGRFRKEFTVPGHVTVLTLSPDAGRLFVGTLTEEAKKTYTVSEWDAVQGKKVRDLGTHKEPVITLAWNAEGDQLLSASWSQVKCWSLPMGTLRDVIVFPESQEIFTAQFVPGGNKIACVVNRSLHLFDLGEPGPKKLAKEIFEFKGHTDTIVGLAISADGKRAVSSSRDGTIRSWDLVKRSALHELKKSSLAGSVWTSLALADDGKSVLSCWRDMASDTGAAVISLWDAATGKEHWTGAGHYRGTVPIRIRGKQALVGGGPNVLTQWDLARGVIERSWGGPKAPVSAVQIDARGRNYSAGQDGVIHVWEKDQVARSIPAHAEPILAMALSPDQAHLYTASGDRTVKVWDVATGKLRQTLTGHTGSVTAVLVGKQGKRAYTASSDRTIKVWDLETGKAVATLTGHADAVNALALTADEAWLASGSDDTTIRVWPIKADRIDADREGMVLEQHKKPITCLAFSADGKTLLSGSQDNTVKVWDWARDKARTLAGHKNWITSLVLVGDGRQVVTTSDDLSICRWNLESGRETGRIDLGVIGDCPRCVAVTGPNRLVVGTSSWMLFEFEMGKK